MDTNQLRIKSELVQWEKEFTDLRHDLHAHPETAFEEVRTAAIVTKKLKEFGIEAHTGLAKTGVVGVLKVGTSDKNIALRADMDALDLEELNHFAHRSVYPGKMHGCGHDGHTIMLLAAAKYLAATKNFDGTVYFIFQPAEENHAGARVMIQDGLFERFPATQIYGMHNIPGIPVGCFGMRTGPVMASADYFDIQIIGKGTHAALPHLGADPIVVGSEMIMAFQQIVSRFVEPTDSAVVSVTQFHAGSTLNVIPETAVLKGTVRTFDEDLQNQIQQKMDAICRGLAIAHGVKIDFKYERRYCPTVNTFTETNKAVQAAQKVVGVGNVLQDLTPKMGAEDFGWMLREKPGCYAWIGNGDGADSCMIHNPHYDFNDKIIMLGASYWIELTESELQ